ncbi:MULTISPECIES: phage portal protein [Peribacillus]|uniref:phage portal protein n=1 Tax=Peribacillus TaxID=2675229 RepID=UPI001F4F0ED2|nr:MULTISPECIES: phage portal protein [unclassified Peribacillus]MCK1985176.1 phage portal protein [Peribacillus sp. Aquil_B1]MCK2007174.1 phage portal protein [Peribacillus sp. Aquil_B8]
MSLFNVGEYFPPQTHQERVERYRKNKLIFKGDHSLFNNDVLTGEQASLVFIASNLPGTIAKKSADFLFMETPVYSAGKDSNSKEQKAIERLVEENDLHITNYESALSNAYRGDSFYKIRWGQKYGGLLNEDTDPYRVFIEAQKAGYVFPETLAGDDTSIYAYHIAVPKVVDGTGDQDWILNVESHYPGKITYSKYRMSPFRNSSFENAVVEWKIQSEIVNEQREISTDVPFPLLVHVPNYSTDEDWQGIDDISENEGLFAEIDNRLSRIAEILDKHSDPLLIVPSGTLGEDAQGNPTFKTSEHKVVEIMDKSEVVPQYVTWNGQLDAAFKQLELLLEHLLIVSEIPPVALGKTDSGTSGASGFSVKWRLNPLLAKVSRKRQYYDKALKHVLLIAQLLEHAKSSQKPDYEVTVPKIKFKDGLPEDAYEQAQITQIRTGGKPVQSQLHAIMETHGYTEEQARIELARINEEEASESFVDSDVFNSEGGGDN